MVCWKYKFISLSGLKENAVVGMAVWIGEASWEQTTASWG